MNVEYGPTITGIGAYVPEMVVTNKDLVDRGMDTTDEWISKNTGIKERHIASYNEATSDLVTAAACRALSMADLEPGKIDQIIVATATPDMFFPSTACRVQDNLKAQNSAAFDLSAACAGGIYALAYATAMHQAGLMNDSLVAGGETLSRIVNKEDRHTAILFGDGAGAVVIQNRENPGPSHFVLRADGSKGDLLMLPGGGSRFPATRDTVEEGLHYVQMKGHPVFKEAVNRMSEVAVEVMNKAELTDAHGAPDSRKIKWVIPHQANQRIIDAVGRRLNIPSEKMFSNIAKYGNTSAASIFIAINELYEGGKLHEGDKLLLVAFGGGFTYAAGVIQWNIKAPPIPLKERLSRIIHF